MSVFPRNDAFKPTPHRGGLRRKGRGWAFHVAVANVPELAPRSSASWHFYVAKNGRLTQYIDTDYVSWCTGAGNPTLISVETEGGVNNPETEPWTDAQVLRLADLVAHYHMEEWYPLKPMANSLPQEKGIGWHKLGVNPWRVPNGELWSSSAGKICPGKAKIAQIPGIIYIAQQVVNRVHEQMNPGTNHVVRAGETLYSISRLYNVTVESIVRLNNLPSTVITIGQNLRVR